MTWLRQLALLLLWVAGSVTAVTSAFAQDVLPVPVLTARVIDQSGTLSPADQQALEAKLAAFETEAGAQLVVLMVPTTQPEDIASYAQRVGEAWKIGRRDIGDGLLIVVAKGDRRIWIATAKALEGAVPDVAAAQIIRDAIRPRFKQDDFAGGLSAGIDALSARIRDEKLPAPEVEAWTPPQGLGGMNPLELMIFGFVALPIVAMVTRSIFGRLLGTLASAGVAGGLTWMLTQTLWLAGIGAFIGLMVGMFSGTARTLRSATRRHGGWVGTGGWTGGDWTNGGGGWGGGGGGFSSGGGGDFGGGGAGGDW